MKKRLLIAIILASLLLSMMTGCASKPQEATEPQESAAAQETQPTEEAPAEETTPAETQEAPEETAEAPAEGEEPTAEPEEPAIAKPEEYTLPLNEEPVAISIFYPTRSGNHPSKSSDAVVFWRRLEEQLGYSITWTEPYQSTAAEQFNLTIASGEYPNIVFESLLARSGSAYTGGYDLAVEEEVYLDLTPYLEEFAPHYNYLLQDPGIYNDIVTNQGRIASFATINHDTAKTGMGPVINKEYWEATGLELPDTVEKLHDVAVAMRNNGVKSPLAVTAEGSIVEGLVSAAMGASFSGALLIDNASGELILDATTNETRAYIELFSQWYQEGILDNDFLSITEMDFSGFNKGEIGTSSGMGFMLDSYYDMYGVYQQPLPVIHADGLGDKEILLASWPASPVNSMPGIALCTSCEEDDVVEACMRMCDFFYSDTGYLATNYGWVEGETYEFVDGKPIPTAFFDERNADLGIANKSLYTSDGDFGYVYPNFNFDVGSDTLVAASELWDTPTDQPNALYTSLPENMKLTADESESIGSAYTDLQTTIESTVLKWMVGEAELTDQSWNDFVAQCQSMDLDRIIEVYTVAYERYTSK